MKISEKVKNYIKDLPICDINIARAMPNVVLKEKCIITYTNFEVSSYTIEALGEEYANNEAYSCLWYDFINSCCAVPSHKYETEINPITLCKVFYLIGITTEELICEKKHYREVIDSYIETTREYVRMQRSIARSNNWTR